MAQNVHLLHFLPRYLHHGAPAPGCEQRAQLALSPLPYSQHGFLHATTAAAPAWQWKQSCSTAVARPSTIAYSRSSKPFLPISWSSQVCAGGSGRYSGRPTKPAEWGNIRDTFGDTRTAPLPTNPRGSVYSFLGGWGKRMWWRFLLQSPGFKGGLEW